MATGARNERASALKQRRQKDAAAGCHASDGRPSAASLPLIVLALGQSATVGVCAPGGRTQRAVRSTGHSDADSALHPARASRLICQSLCNRPCCQ
eukprot:5547579-Prymnesium_polylepis.1